MSLRKSGLQREVLSLYRRALRMVHNKPELTRPKFLLFVRYNFHKQASAVSPRDIGAIEHLLRRGRRQIEMSENPNVKDCWVSREMEDWENRHFTRSITC